MDICVYKFPDVLPGFENNWSGITIVKPIYDNCSEAIISIRDLVFQEGSILMEGNTILTDLREWYTQCCFCNTKYNTRNMLIIIEGELKTVMCPQCYNNLVLG
jgi:hypothetical protein